MPLPLLLLVVVLRAGLDSHWVVCHLAGAGGGAGDGGQGDVGEAGAGGVLLRQSPGARWQQQGTRWHMVLLLLLLLLMVGLTPACACSCCHTRLRCLSCGQPSLLLRRC